MLKMEPAPLGIGQTDAPKYWTFACFDDFECGDGLDTGWIRIFEGIDDCYLYASDFGATIKEKPFEVYPPRLPDCEPYCESDEGMMLVRLEEGVWKEVRRWLRP